MNTEIKKVMKPKALKRGDNVGLVAPASRPYSPRILKRCIAIIEEMGLKPIVGKHVLDIYSYMAGSDESRLNDLQNFLDDDSIAGIFCLTGGFGSIHLLKHLNYKRLASTPKVIVGCDDNCHLLIAMHALSGLVTFHGPNLDQINSQYTFQNLQKAIMEKDQFIQITSQDSIDDNTVNGFIYAPVNGIVSGALLGGNLTSLVSLMGTPYQPCFDDTILFFEDKNERIDILDRWFTTLELSGELSKTNGIVLGQFENCNEKGLFDLLSLEDLLETRLIKLNKPACFNFPIGQGHKTVTLPMGIQATLDSNKGMLELHESGVF